MKYNLYQEKMKYNLYQDAGLYDSFDDLNRAIDLAESLLKSTEGETTFTVQDLDGQVIASFSNRRITGSFVKQKWTGRDGREMAQVFSEEEFDATDHILLMDYDYFKKIKDGDDSSDEVGNQFIQWDGPFDVNIHSSIEDYFGIAPEEVTRQHFEFVKNRVNPKPAEEDTVEVTFKLKIRKNLPAETQGVINDIEYSFMSQTPGVIIVDSEMVDARPRKPRKP